MHAPTSHSNQNLKTKREDYQYNYSHIPPLAMVDKLSAAEEPAFIWRLMVAKVIFKIMVNTIIVKRGDRGKVGAADDVKAFFFEVFIKTLANYRGIPARINVLWQGAKFVPKILFRRLSTNVEDEENLIKDILQSISQEFLDDLVETVRQNLVLTEQEWENHEDFQDLFQTIPLPEIAYSYQKDEVFATLRVAGPNPVMLQRFVQSDPRFPVTQAQYQAVMGDSDSLTQAYAEGRLYLADYAILDGAINGSFPQAQKYLYAPIALFAVPKSDVSDRHLRPVAIQGGQDPHTFPIITPKANPYAWRCAKAMVQIADANFHEAVSHLARTHLMVGPFVIATHRQLPDTHPLSLLLRPHFQGTLAINDGAQSRLIAAGGGVDTILAATIDNSRIFAVLGLQTYPFNTAMLPTQLKNRGVDDTETFPNYPYRDDGLLIWEAIHNWVEDYLKLYYADDTAVQQDTALQQWAQELVSPMGGRVVGFGEAAEPDEHCESNHEPKEQKNRNNQQLKTVSYLIDAVTLIIFTASAQHAAVNFPQKDIMSFAPAMPTAGYAGLNNLGDRTTEQDYLSLLPPLTQAQQQLNILHLLGSVQFTQLGQYAANHFKDAQVQAPLEKFQIRLEEIEEEIHWRNRDRPTYEYLLPSRIPQSINI